MTTKVKFLRDFQGKATKEVFYKQGDVVEVDDPIASAVIAEGVAERLVESAPHYGAVKVVEVDQSDQLRDDEKIYEQFIAESAEEEAKPKGKRSRK